MDCAACCFSRSSHYVELSPKERQNASPRLRALTHSDGARIYLRMVSAGHCAALVAAGQHYRCSIYEERPAPCRELLAGSPACLEERREKRRMVAAARALAEGV